MIQYNNTVAADVQNVVLLGGPVNSDETLVNVAIILHAQLALAH